MTDIPLTIVCPVVFVFFWAGVIFGCWLEHRFPSHREVRP